MSPASSEPATGSDWSRVKLHVVTGKGGTGKSTVAAALALALASARQERAALRGRGPPGHRPDVRRRRRCPTRSAGSRPACGPDGSAGAVHALHIDPESALLEYLAMYYKLGRAGRRSTGSA